MPRQAWLRRLRPPRPKRRHVRHPERCRQRRHRCHRWPGGGDMTGRKKHIAPKRRGPWSHIYKGRELAFVIERHADGWHLISHPQGELAGTYATFRLAVAMANARIARAPGAPIPGERDRDAKHVKQIRKH